jgi:hypothetical protein
MTGRLFNGEHNLRVRSRKTILELEPGLDAGRADPGAAGQTEKAHVFRFVLELEHSSMQADRYITLGVLPFLDLHRPARAAA